MTAQEAYAELISIRKNREDGYLTHLSYGGKADEHEEYTIEAYSVALNALEKQIPKKVTKSACPSCNRIFLFRHSEKRKGDYCDNCGQALDWSDNNA